MVSRQPELRLMVFSAIAIGIVLAFLPNISFTPSPGDGHALFVFRSPQAVAVEGGQALFEQKCKSCHSIGGGRLVGPDLKGITAIRDKDWLIRFITTPDKLIAEGDPLASQLVQQYGLPMPNVGVTDDDAKAILAYIDAQSSESKPSPTPAEPTVTLSPTVSVLKGKAMFTGELAFKNSGPACMSCHNMSGVGLLGGGTVGKDLTTAYSSLGEIALRSLLKTTPFPMMKEIYTTRPLTDEEIGSVVAFLKDRSTSPTSTQNPALFFVIGGMGALMVIGLFHFLWRGRLSGVRRSLVKGGSK